MDGERNNVQRVKAMSTIKSVTAQQQLPPHDSSRDDAAAQEHDPSQHEERRRHRSTTLSGGMPRQWIVDRCDGTSKYNPESRPPCSLCYVPVPVKYMPHVLEQNCLCEMVGKWGCIRPEQTVARKRLFQTAFVFNVLGLLCLLVSMFAIATRRHHIVRGVEFTNIWLQLVSGPESSIDIPVYFSIGLRAIAYENKISNVRGLMSFADICDKFDELDTTISLVAKDPAWDCNSCEDITQSIVPSLFLSMLSYIPNFTTDILRIYSNYDVNCQKFLASTFSWISLATAIYTWVRFLARDVLIPYKPIPLA